MSSEFVVLFLSYKTSFYLYQNSYPSVNYSNENNFIILICSIINLLIYLLSSHYTGKTSYVDKSFAYHVFFRNILALFSSVFIIDILSNQNYPIIVYALLYFKLCTFIILFRLFIGYLLSSIEKNTDSDPISIAIYGTEATAVQLAKAIKLNNNYKISCFLDHKKDILGRSLLGIKIRNLKNIESGEIKVSQILLANPDLSKDQKRELLTKVEKANIPIREVPSIESTINLLYGNSVSLEDIIGRETKIKSSDEDLKNGFKGKIICITGAGGSIGSELCRCILKLQPAKLFLLDNSEISLYNLEKEIRKKAKLNNVSFVLCDALNYKSINNLFLKNKVDILFHAAAYKHVPLLEANPIQGLLNNVISTKNLCLSSLNSGVKEFVFISSDKAVRPSSIMGASKRLSELIVRSFHNKALNKGASKQTCFSMVRFGNVLGSSGSVIPLFNEQIRNGGPVTVTDKNMTRYFMTIEEAASLVLQASRLSKGGEVFLLDMGEPIKIYELAKKLIRLNGYNVKDKNNKSNKGSIAIEFTGIRKGEKLYEELLIENNSSPTNHPLIYIANEKWIEEKILFEKLKILEDHLLNDNYDSLKILSELVPEWKTPKNN